MAFLLHKFQLLEEFPIQKWPEIPGKPPKDERLIQSWQSCLCWKADSANELVLLGSLFTILIVNNKCWQGCGKIGTFMYYWKCKVVQPLWKTLWQFPQKLELLYDPTILLVGLYPKGLKAGRDFRTLFKGHVHSSIHSKRKVGATCVYWQIHGLKTIFFSL